MDIGVLQGIRRSLDTLATEARTTRRLAIANAGKYREITNRLNHRDAAEGKDRENLLQEVRKLRKADETILKKIEDAEAADGADNE